MTSTFSIGKCRLPALLTLGTLAFALLPQGLSGRDAASQPGPKIFVHQGALASTDTLLDGKTPIEITAPTRLIWVDSMPGARYSHPTEYILISAAGTRVVPGNWWPVLNGKDLFRDAATYLAEFPLDVSDTDGARPEGAKSDPDRLTGMKAALADLQAGRLKIKSPALPVPAWNDSYLDLLAKECGIEWETVDDATAQARTERKGYNDLMILEIEHRFGKGILEKLQKRAEQSFRRSLDAQ